MTVCGREIVWDTSGASSQQLDNFCHAFAAALAAAPHTCCASDAALHRSAHLICKALSINYVLSDVMGFLRLKLKARASDMYTVRAGGGGDCALRPEYGVDVHPGPLLRAYMSWRSPGNVVSYDVATAKMRVRGTLSHVETWLPLAPHHGFWPEYGVRFEQRRSKATRLVSKISCVSAARRGRGRAPLQALKPQAPLDLQTAEAGPQAGASSEFAAPVSESDFSSSEGSGEDASLLHRASGGRTRAAPPRAGAALGSARGARPDRGRARRMVPRPGP